MKISSIYSQEIVQRKLTSTCISNRTHCETKALKTTVKQPDQLKKYSGTLLWRSHVQVLRCDVFLRRASYLRLSFSFLMVEKVWHHWRLKTSKRLEEDTMKLSWQHKGNCGVVLLKDLVWPNYSLTSFSCFGGWRKCMVRKKFPLGVMQPLPPFLPPRREGILYWWTCF